MLKHYSYMCVFVVGFFTIVIITKADGFWLVACLSLIGPYCVNWITIGRFGYRKSHKAVSGCLYGTELCPIATSSGNTCTVDFT